MITSRFGNPGFFCMLPLDVSVTLILQFSDTTDRLCGSSKTFTYFITYKQLPGVLSILATFSQTFLY